jgi:hypothetical protein
MEWWDRMSEFKFACPICNQHITADATASGTELECPTCFQKIIVPQAPASEDTKFILSASQAAKPRPVRFTISPDSSPAPERTARNVVPIIAILLVLLCAGSATILVWHGKVSRQTHETPKPQTNVAPMQVELAPWQSPYSAPTNIAWTLELTNAVIPDAPLSGRIHGNGFRSERATLNGGTLSLRQGRSPFQPDLAISVALLVPRSEQLSGQTVVISSSRPPPVPRVTLRWKERPQQALSETIDGGYAMKLTFGRITNGHLHGSLYLALQDEAKSYAAGTFDAEIRQGRGPGR